MQTIAGSILTPNGWIQGQLAFDHYIHSITGEAISIPEPPYILPGFIDLHVHGGAGADVMEGEAAIETVTALHANHGTTSLLLTSVTASDEDTQQFLISANNAMQKSQQGSRILGVHLEGPFINNAKLGAQPDMVQPPDWSKVENWMSMASIAVMTLAPECDENQALIQKLIASGVRVQLGHSLCSYAQASRAIACGCGVTHLYNAMSGHAHRGNGLAGAALAHSEYAEIIVDFHHVEPGAVLAARRAIPKLYSVTDASSGTGMEDGAYKMGTHTIYKQGEKMVLVDGTLAGSALTMDQALKNWISLGVSLEEASDRLSRYPAQWLGCSDIGELATGKRADMVILDESYSLLSVWADGQLIR